MAQLPVHCFFFGNSFFLSGYSLTQARIIWAERQRPRTNLFWQEMVYFSSPVFRAVHFLPGVATILLPPTTQELWVLWAWTSQNHSCWPSRYGNAVQLKSRVQEWRVSAPVRVWSGCIPLDTFYCFFMVLLIVLRWHSANDLVHKPNALEADRPGFSTQLSNSPAECPP